jgi:hypothetical protein
MSFLAPAAALALALALTPGIARADHCGAEDCGPSGRCREQSLIAKCDCDEGHFSVTTYLGGGSQGAWCVRLPAAPNDRACEDLACGPHGSCVRSGDEVLCLCDAGYRRDRDRGCVDDPEDEREAPCAPVLCGEGATCMATDDAVTCRCRGGEYVVIGLDADGHLGPVCQAPANPETACGPEACGPFGECVISQAFFCRCEDGTEVEERRAPGGKLHPICVDFEQRFPDAGAPLADAGDIGRRESADGGACCASCGLARAARRPGPAARLLLIALGHWRVGVQLR